MRLWNGVMRLARRTRREHVKQRAARVMDRAMFDVGIVNFVNGAVMLDEQLRPRFFSATAQRPAGVARVELHQLAEARALLGLACTFDLQAGDRLACRTALLHGVLREFHSQSPSFRSLR